jgi:probable phosphoglycerate mutase
MIVFLIRHGETVTSGRTYAGRSDVPLTAHGHAQAHRLARCLSNRPLSLVLCSPLVRAMDTARPLALVHGLALQIEPALTEIDFGRFEGADKTRLGLSLRRDHAECPVPGGESLRDVWMRAGVVLETLRAHHRGCCALVGHFWINRLIYGRAQGLTFEAACRAREYRPTTGSCVAIDLCPGARQGSVHTGPASGQGT